MPDIEAIPILEEELVVVASPRLGDWAAIDAFLGKSDQARILVFRAGCSYRQRMEDVLVRRGFADVLHMEMGTLDGIIGCASAGIGIALLPRGVVELAAAQGHLSVHALPDGQGKAQTVFIRRRDAFLSGAMRRFVDTAVATSSVLDHPLRNHPEPLDPNPMGAASPQPLLHATGPLREQQGGQGAEALIHLEP